MNGPLGLYATLASLLLPARAQFRASRRRNARGFAQYQGSKSKARLLRRGAVSWAERHLAGRRSVANALVRRVA